jgi:hypothetical protein
MLTGELGCGVEPAQLETGRCEAATAGPLIRGEPPMIDAGAVAEDQSRGVRYFDRGTPPAAIGPIVLGGHNCLPIFAQRAALQAIQSLSRESVS